MIRPVLCALLVPLASGCASSDTEDKASCDPGDICPWFGTPEIAGMSPEGTLRTEASTFWVVDVVFHPTEDWPVIMDWNNHRLITFDDADELVVLTGVGGRLGDGPEGDASLAEWNHPTDVAWLSDDTMVMAAWHNSRIVQFDPDFETMSFVSGTGDRDFSGDGGPAIDAVLDLPCGIRVDESDNILISDMANQRIRQISPDGTIDTVAGTGAHGFNGDGPALDTMLASPALQRAEPAFKIDYALGKVYIADTHNGRIRTFDPATDTIATVAGKGITPPDSSNGTVCTGGCGYSGDGGPATQAMLDTPSDVAVANDGTIYIADTENSCVRIVDPDGIIDTFAGICGERGFSGDLGPADEALLNRPFGVAIDAEGRVYISDTYNSVIRVVEPE